MCVKWLTETVSPAELSRQDQEDSGFGAAMMCSITEEPLAPCRLKGPPKLFTQGWNVSSDVHS